MYFIFNYLLFLQVSIILFVVALTLIYKRIKFFEKRIYIGKFFHERYIKFFIIIFLIMFLFFFMYGVGEYAAKTLAHDQNGGRIILETSGGWQSPKDAVLIAHMNNKYFIYNFSSDKSNREIYIIEDSQTTKVTLLKKTNASKALD